MILMDDLDVMVAKPDILNDLHAIVRRTIVHDNDLKVLVGQSLAIDTFQTRPDVLFYVTNRNNDTEFHAISY
jgi:hypothetical protein